MTSEESPAALKRFEKPADSAGHAGDQREAFANERTGVRAEPEPLRHIVDERVKNRHVVSFQFGLALAKAKGRVRREPASG